jgi:hypothetical protein
MKRAFLFLITLTPFFTFEAQAGVARDAAEVAREVSYAENYLSPSQEIEIQQHLQAIRNVLKGSPGGSQPGKENYVCVSRDNDGRNPWMLGVRDFTNIVRIPGTVTNTKEDCEKNLNNTRLVRGGLLACFTRDDDGRNPWRMNFLGFDNRLILLDRAITNDYQTCVRTTNDTKITRDGILYCASRDEDGRNPYVIVGYRMDGSGSSVGNETYFTYEQCKAAL